ncbi:hypothetical protein ACQJBY_041684 [Aegilops geniculata]
MAAVRCAARRLGGSLLQRTQAEEGRRLVPSRLMRSRHLSNSTEQASMIKQKEEELYDAISKAEQKKKELFDAIYNAGKISTTTGQHLSVQATQGADDPLRWMRYAMRARGVFELAAKMTLTFMAFAFAFGSKANKVVEAKEDQ